MRRSHLPETRFHPEILFRRPARALGTIPLRSFRSALALRNFASALFPLFFALAVPTAPVAAASAAGPILSEALADPVSVADAQGEFLELGNPDADTLRLDSLRVTVDAQSLLLTGWSLAPGALYLICRDSLPAANGGMACHRQWSALSLANSRGAGIGLDWNGGRNGYALPAPRPGVSWENTWDPAADYRAFAATAVRGNGGDSATPGIRNSRSARPAQSDLGIMEMIWSPAAGPGIDTRDAVGGAVRTGGGSLRIRVRNLGSGAPGRSRLSLRLDADWDGDAETPLDSLPVVMPAEGDRVVSFDIGAGLRGIVRAVLAPDENPFNDVFLLPVEPDRPLAITEWRHAPSTDEPEWVEIRNTTADGGGIGRHLELKGAAFRGIPLGTEAGGLDPGSYLVLTASADRFRARYGPIKADLLQLSGWKALRNTGDTLILSLAGFTVDSVAYGADGFPLGEGGARPGAGPARESGTREGMAGTPGYAAPAIASNGWNLSDRGPSGRVAGPGRPLDVEVRTLPGRNHVLRLFDLEGNLVRELGRGGPGRTFYAWDGRGREGAALRPGPYILCLSIDGCRPLRTAVVLTGPP